jgi:hypothetical protein
MGSPSRRLADGTVVRQGTLEQVTASRFVRVIPPRGLREVTPRMVEALDMRDARMPRQAIADHFGCALGTLDRWLEIARDARRGTQ